MAVRTVAVVPKCPSSTAETSLYDSYLEMRFVPKDDIDAIGHCANCKRIRPTIATRLSDGYLTITVEHCRQCGHQELVDLAISRSRVHR
jgi:hypothetical protein